jgi:hypothetical protein
VLPSLKVTVPVGLPPNWPVIVAVKVTDWPSFDGLCDDARLVVVVALSTVCPSVAELLAFRSLSPP